MTSAQAEEDKEAGKYPPKMVPGPRVGINGGEGERGQLRAVGCELAVCSG